MGAVGARQRPIDEIAHGERGERLDAHATAYHPPTMLNGAVALHGVEPAEVASLDLACLET